MKTCNLFDMQKIKFYLPTYLPYIQSFFFALTIALKGWPVVGCIPLMIKEMRSAGFNNLYHRLQLQFGLIYKMKGLGKPFRPLKVNF